MFGRALVDDPRTQPGAMITDGQRLFEVTRQLDMDVRAEDCRDGVAWTISFIRIAQCWQLVRPAPAVPDFPEVFSPST